MSLGCQAFSSLLMAASTKGLMSLRRLLGFEHMETVVAPIRLLTLDLPVACST